MFKPHCSETRKLTLVPPALPICRRVACFSKLIASGPVLFAADEVRTCLKSTSLLFDTPVVDLVSENQSVAWPRLVMVSANSEKKSNRA